MNTPPIPPNPYDYINPVQDPKMFAGRQDELLAIAEEVRRLKGVHITSPVVAIVGARRVGKTSLLQRVEEKCSAEGLLPVLMTITDTTASHPREFWRDLFDSILRSGTNVGIFERPGEIKDFGFLRSGNKAPTTPQELQFAKFYLNNLPIPMQVLQDDLLALMKSVVDSSLGGMMLLLDEAHLLTECREISQQIRAVVREVPRCGIAFAGEPRLGGMFTDESQPLFGQARMIHLGNFQSSNDVALSVLVPLTEDQRVLVSPMTIDYLSRLSQGKPNQIRLICNSVYRRYERGQQADLNITIEALDDVLESIESSYALDYDLRTQVQRIQRLSSVDLELLFGITRYPQWSSDDLVQLDESFRGEAISPLARARRRRALEVERSRFVSLGLLVDDPNVVALAGDEFLNLYLRFWYEVRKFGKLQRRLILGKGPTTLFAERVEKLVRFLNWQAQKRPSFSSHHWYGRDEEGDDVINGVRRRYQVLAEVLSGGRAPTTGDAEIINECLHVSELVKESGKYLLVALSLRDLDNPRDSVRVEVYFGDELVVVPIALIRDQAESARVWLEDFDYWPVNLPDLPEFLEAIKGSSFEEILASFPMVQRWFIQSIRRHIGAVKTDDDDFDDSADSTEWIDLYRAADSQGALDSITRRLAKTKFRWITARLYNDRGYIKYPDDPSTAKADLGRALDLHYRQLH